MIKIESVNNSSYTCNRMMEINGVRSDISQPTINYRQKLPSFCHCSSVQWCKPFISYRGGGGNFPFIHLKKKTHSLCSQCSLQDERPLAFSTDWYHVFISVSLFLHHHTRQLCVLLRDFNETLVRLFECVLAPFYSVCSGVWPAGRTHKVHPCIYNWNCTWQEVTEKKLIQFLEKGGQGTKWPIMEKTQETFPNW